MPTPIQRRAITEDLSPDLHTAMSEMLPERQSPADFLDMACALAAVLRSHQP